MMADGRAGRVGKMKIPERESFSADYASLSMNELQRKYRCSQRTLFKWKLLLGLDKKKVSFEVLSAAGKKGSRSRSPEGIRRSIEAARIKPVGFSEGCRQRQLGKKLSEETKKRMSDTHKSRGEPVHLRKYHGYMWKFGTEKQKVEFKKMMSDLANERWKNNLAKWNAKNKGKFVAKSEPQVNIFLWAKNRFRDDAVEINYPFEDCGKFAFGDVVLLNKKIVIEYDEPYWHSSEKAKFYNGQHDKIICANGFMIIHVNYVCFEELEEMIINVN